MGQSNIIVLLLFVYLFILTLTTIGSYLCLLVYQKSEKILLIKNSIYIIRRETYTKNMWQNCIQIEIPI